MQLETILSSTLEQIRANIEREKIDFQGESEFLALSSYSDVRDSLVMRWNNIGIMQQSACQGCKGRLGYIVVPYKVGNLSYRGLFQVIIRVTHDELFINRFKEYRFIVRGP